MSKMPSLIAEPAAASPELTVVVPVLNEERNVPLIAERLTGVLSACVASHEILFIDDGSRDGTLAAIRALAATDVRIRCVSFSRNFGKEVALAAGLDHARGQAVVMIDADLQHPPETIPLFVENGARATTWSLASAPTARPTAAPTAASRGAFTGCSSVSPRRRCPRARAISGWSAAAWSRR